jgi:hypothetical protein
MKEFTPEKSLLCANIAANVSHIPGHTHHIPLAKNAW